jgi:hypothetical protein
MTYNRFDIKKLIITERSIFEGNVCFDSNVTICGDLQLAGNLNNITIGSSIATTPQGLLGMWPMNRVGSLATSNSQFSNFDGDIGEKNSRDFFHPLNEWNNLKQQFTPGKVVRTLSYFFQENFGSNFNYLASANVDTGVISYVGPINRHSSTYAPVYDPLLDRFLALRTSDGGLIEYNPDTGVDTEILASSGANFGEYSASVLVNDSIFFSNLDTNIQSSPILYSFNRVSGVYNGSITWTGNYIFSGTIFEIDNSERLLSMALDPTIFRVYFLLGKSQKRYLGYYQSTSLAQLETDLQSGSFNITLCIQVPSEPLHAIAWVPVPDLTQ